MHIASESLPPYVVILGVEERKGKSDIHRFSYTVGSTVITTTRLVMMSATATKVMRKMEPLLAGNLPRMIQYCKIESAYSPLPSLLHRMIFFIPFV